MAASIREDNMLRHMILRQPLGISEDSTDIYQTEARNT